MQNNRYKNNRKANRLPYYDYSQPGSYFLTICTQNKCCLFGDIIDAQMHPNDSGLLLDRLWNDLPNHFTSISLDTYVIMPNHIHGIINIELAKGATISTIMQNFKTISTYEYSMGVKRHHWKTFDNRLWQRSFYEHVIRNDKSLDRIRQYIVNNPQQWDLDIENPQSKSGRT